MSCIYIYVGNLYAVYLTLLEFLKYFLDDFPLVRITNYGISRSIICVIYILFLQVSSFIFDCNP